MAYIRRGEPTENPLFFEFIDEFYKVFDETKDLLTICSNGHFISENQEKMNFYLDKYKMLFIQITYDNKYYPIKLDVTKRIFRHKKCTVDTVPYIRPQGRAITNNLPIAKYYPPACINVKLITLQLKGQNLETILKRLRLANKQCIPSIQYDGSIGFGELDSCPKLIDIYDTEENIISKMAHLDYSCCPVEYEHTDKNICLMVEQLERQYDLENEKCKKQIMI